MSFKRFKKIAKWMIGKVFSWSFILAGFSILTLILKYFELGPSSFIVFLVEKYDGYVNKLFENIQPWVEEFIILISSYLTVDFSLNDNWKHASVILIFYMGADVVTTIVRGRKASFGLLFVITIVILIANTINMENNIFSGFAIAMLSFFVFDFVQAIIDASLYSGDRKKPTVFYYYIKTMALPSLVFFILCINLHHIPQIPTNKLIPFLIFITLIVLRNMTIGGYHAHKFRKDGQTRLSRFGESNTGQLGWHLMKALGVAFAGAVL